MSSRKFLYTDRVFPVFMRQGNEFLPTIMRSLHKNFQNDILEEKFEVAFTKFLTNYDLNNIEERLKTGLGYLFINQIGEDVLNAFIGSLPLSFNEFPRSVDEINDEAFRYCDSLFSPEENIFENESETDFVVSIDDFIDGHFGRMSYYFEISNNKYVEAEKLLKQFNNKPGYMGKKISSDRKKAYIEIIKIIVNEERSEAEAIRKYNLHHDPTIRESAFSYFKTHFNDLYHQLVGGIKKDFDDQKLLSLFP